MGTSLEGTTYVGGHGNGTGTRAGTVFKIAPGGALTTLYDFCSEANCADGQGPLAGLVQATNGDLYGTTFPGELRLLWYGIQNDPEWHADESSF
jgi:hypothetical protein